MTTILCIEDEVSLRADISEELGDAGYNVKLAGDGEEGLEMILKYQPDLVLCDITMPKKNGYALLSEIRGKYPLLAEMPFIFLSALTDKELILNGLKCGADSYLTKPIDFELLLTTIQTSLRQINRIKLKQERFLVLDI